MNFGVFDLINKARPRVGESHVYAVISKKGKKWTKWFAAHEVGQIPKFLANNPTAVLVSHPGEHKVEQKLIIATEASVAATRLEHDKETRAAFVRIGDSLGRLDPEASVMAKELLSLDAQLETDPANRALLQKRDALRIQLHQRPLAGKILRIGELQGRIAMLKKQGDDWKLANPERWASLYIEPFRKRAAEAAKEGKAVAPEPVYPTNIASEIYTLEQRLRGVRGKTTAIQVGGPKLGVGESVKILSSAVTTVTRGSKVPLVVAVPADGAVSYSLTAGTWPTQDEKGRNLLTNRDASALYKEYADIINNIVSGKAWGANRPGFATLFDIKGAKEDLKAELSIELLSAASKFTADVALQHVERGSNFRAFAINKLVSKAKHVMKNLVDYAKATGSLDAHKENEVAGDALYFNEDGVANRDILQKQGAPLATGYASPEDIISIRGAKLLIKRKLSVLESVGLMSRLNLHNTNDKLDGDSGLKSWDEVADDVVAEMAKRGKQVGHAAVKAKLIRKIDKMFTVPEPGKSGWASTLTKRERESLREGLKSIIRVVAQRQVSMPQPMHHNVVAVEVARDMDPTKGHSPPQKLRITKDIPAGTHSFWENEKRTGHASAAHLDPAHELDLAMDLRGATGIIPPNTKLKQLRAPHYAEMFTRMKKLDDSELAGLASSPAFKRYEIAHTESGRAVVAANPEATKPVAFGEALTVGGVTVSGVRPNDVLKMADLIRRQRAIDKKEIPLVVSKALHHEFDVELAGLFLKMRRLLKLKVG